ncbi:MAG: ATP phosphoribosyltransferase regulatory subunit [Clostridia bacterium]|nr:ATP phosphoribosyltransferase regulatory subunit [Clostridia bacterium]
MQDDSLKRHAPAGTQDYLPAACRHKRSLEAVLRGVFERAGYDEIETPVFEHYDVFTHDAVPYVQEEIVKFFDRQGRILALRPDVTGPIARMSATKLLPSPEPLRLFYMGNVYGLRRPGEQVESAQAGVELIGADGTYADAETVALAIESLRSLGLESFSIEIGQVAYFRGLLAGTDLSERQREQIRHLINDKNSVELEYTLSRLQLSGQTKQALLELPGLFGGAEALDRASGDSDMCREALDNLRSVLKVLEAYGMTSYISVDLGLLHDFQYYSGLIFRGLASDIGRPVLSGGRYDGLLGEFGCEAPATGFAIRLTRLMRALGMESEPAERPLMLRFEADEAGQAAALARRLRSRGRRVVLAGPQAPADALDWNGPEIEELLC